jgi:hypothetical protein
MTLAEMAAEVRRLSYLIEAANQEQRDQGKAFAQSEQTYRQAKPEAWAKSADMGMLAKEREDWVNGETSDARYERDLADVLRKSAIDAERSYRGILSGWQTLVNAHREEAAFDRTGPR